MEVNYQSIYEGSANLTVYQSPKFIEMLNQVVGGKKVHLTCHKHNAAIPLLAKETSYGIVYNSLPFFGSCGGLIGGQTVCDDLSKNISEIINRSDFASLNVVSNWYNEAEFKINNIEFNEIKRINTSKRLSALNGTSSNSMETYHGKTRNIVRATLKEGLRVVDLSNNFDTVVEMHFMEMKYKNRTPKPIPFWENLIKNNVSGIDYLIFGALLDANILGYILFLLDSNLKQIEYYVPCSTIEGRNINVNYFLLHESISEFARMRYETLHFGGTHLDQKNLLRFKERWGAESREYKYYNTFNSSISKVPMNLLQLEAPFFFIKQNE